MKLAWNDHEEQLHHLMDRHLSGRPDRAARSSDTAAIREWHEFADRLGVSGATLPSSAGGTGGDIGEGMAILSAIGADGALSPFLESVLVAGHVLAQCGGHVSEQLLAGIARGNAIVTLAAHEAGRGYALDGMGTRATRDGDGWRINGDKVVVHQAPIASHLLVMAQIDGEECRPGLFVVASDAIGVQHEAYQLLDGRPAADIRFLQVSVPGDAMIGHGEVVIDRVAAAIDRATVALAAEAVAAMRVLLRMTIDHLQGRRQFGQPLSGFQVLQHRVADMAMATERSVSAMWLAHAALADRTGDRRRGVSAAKIVLADAIRFVCESSIQLHGANGFVEEAPTTRYIKRLMTIDATFGDRAWHMARLTKVVAI